MAARNHSHRQIADEPRRLHHHGRVSSQELHLLEERIAAQSRDIQTLLHDNQRLAVTHVALKQEFISAEQDVRHLSATAASVKSERDAQVREVYNRSLRLEEEARFVDGIPPELDRIRADIQELRGERKELSEKLRDIDEDLARTNSELMELPALRAEIEVLYKEIQRGRGAIEYERKMRAKNYQLSEVMEKHMISMTHEAEKLRSELANAGRRAMEGATVLMAAATPGPAYAAQYGNLEAGYGESSRSDPNAFHQSSVAATPSFDHAAESHAPPPEQPYAVQGQHVHGLSFEGAQ
ncbi:protein FLC EXPRESSOR-like isoform X1 [Primulina huaijiensis]|uniref:protein FLC EXPRESSOR-like isoform X1 n=1 Tax=Primulina huaijiensis TaxID=1492673 RepID=UPI003CC726A5